MTMLSTLIIVYSSFLYTDEEEIIGGEYGYHINCFNDVILDNNRLPLQGKWSITTVFFTIS